jgi:hypothetical protein
MEELHPTVLWTFESVQDVLIEDEDGYHRQVRFKRGMKRPVVMPSQVPAKPMNRDGA